MLIPCKPADLRRLAFFRKLTEFNGLMGYYQIESSELDMPDLEIIDKYHGLTRIEDQLYSFLSRFMA